jgi:hypothetical protein
MQAFAVFLPIRSVGVQGDQRTHNHVVALRAITSADGMTADWFPFPHEFLAKISNKICNEVKVRLRAHTLGVHLDPSERALSHNSARVCVMHVRCRSCDADTAERVAGTGGEPRGVRHHIQAALHHRVGVMRLLRGGGGWGGTGG